MGISQLTAENIKDQASFCISYDQVAGPVQASLFARLIIHQPAVLFSQNEPSHQPQPASSTLLSEQTSTSHQPPATSQPNRLVTM
jgi:hypothetical protein